jgi:predicted restriction endonuclease
VSAKKKQVRNEFNLVCLKRDKYRCVVCGAKATPDNWRDILDVHHITDRNQIVGGGYVKENGVCLCKTGKNCHLIAEQFHITGTAVPGYSPDDLYRKIGSSLQKAIQAAGDAAADEIDL